jgi:atypical dual specificity phosphatase
MIPNFSWVVPDEIAGSGQIGAWGAYADEALANDVWDLKECGVGAIVSLTEKPLDSGPITSLNMDYLHLPIPDMSAPSLGEIERFLSFAVDMIDRGRSVLVHCGAGLGRTGTMLACYLVLKGHEPLAAIQRVRIDRPGSIETEAQEIAIFEYAASLTGKEAG